MDGRLKSSFHPALWRWLFVAHGGESVASGNGPVPQSIFPSVVLFVVTVLIVSGFATSVVAGSKYELVVGEKHEVCRVYKENLESFDFAMEGGDCARKVNPRFPDLHKPQWEELDLEKDAVLVERIAGFFNDSAQIEIGLTKLSGRDLLSVKQARIDIDNDGNTDTIVKYRTGRCEETNLYAAPVVVLLGNKSEIDSTKTSLLLQNRQRNGSIIGRWEYGMYDVFSYKGRSYFDVWSGYEKDVLKIYGIAQDDVKQVCRYRIKH